MYEPLERILKNDLQLSEFDLRPGASLEEAGLDSLALVELAMVVEKELGIRISDDELGAVDSLGEIADLISRRANAAR